MKKIPAFQSPDARVMIAIVSILLASGYLHMLLMEAIHSATLDIDFLKAAYWKLIDPIVLAAIVAPALFYLFSRKQMQHAEIERRLDELNFLQQELAGHEQRMNELMMEVAKLNNPLSVENNGVDRLSVAASDAMCQAAELRPKSGLMEAGLGRAQMPMLEYLEAEFRKIQLVHQEWKCALDAVSDPIFMHDNNFIVMRCNKAYQQCAGISLEQIIGQPYYEIFPKSNAPLLSCLRAMQKDRIEDEELVTVGDTSYRSRAFSVQDAQRMRQFSVHILEDITGKIQVERALRAETEKFRGLVEQSISGIFIVQDGKFAYVNPRFAEIRGFDSADELIGQDPLKLIAQADRSIVMENNRLLLNGEKQNIYFNFTALRKDGSSIEVGVHSILASHLGRPAIVGMQQDISEKKRAERSIQRYIEQLKTAVMSTVGVATTMSEMRDPYTSAHARRVAELAVAISAELGFDERQQEGMRVAGCLHDIGKITVPSEMLSKPGKLSAIEFQLIQGHAQASYDVLKGVEWPWPVAEIALQHHERYDGSGYPQGIKGEDILFNARVMAVADVVEAMSSHRPYRPGLGIDQALAEVERGRGSAYDATVADACLMLFREKGYHLSA